MKNVRTSQWSTFANISNEYLDTRIACRRISKIPKIELGRPVKNAWDISVFPHYFLTRSTFIVISRKVEELSRFDKRVDLNIKDLKGISNMGKYVNLRGTYEMFGRKLFQKRRERLH